MEPGQDWEVIGLIAEARNQLRQPPGPQIYFPSWQDSSRSDVVTLLLNLSTRPTPALLESIQKAIHTVEPAVGVRTPIDLEQQAKAQLAGEKFTLFMLQLVSGLTLALALLTAALACWLPARAAARVDPAELLRSD